MRNFSRHQPNPISGVNMTSMIDVTFLLLFFFMITSRMASFEKSDVKLPHPHHNQSAERKLEEKVLINVRYVGEKTDPALTLGAQTIATMAELSDRLGSIGRNRPDAQVVLRADKRLVYGQVRDILSLVGAAGLTHIQVVTELGPRP